jgi:hypothetical protein
MIRTNVLTNYLNHAQYNIERSMPHYEIFHVAYPYRLTERPTIVLALLSTMVVQDGFVIDDGGAGHNGNVPSIHMRAFKIFDALDRRSVFFSDISRYPCLIGL